MSRWLLPFSLRATALLLAFIGCGLLVLGVVGHFGSSERAVVIGVLVVLALLLAIWPARRTRPISLTTATVLKVNEPAPGAMIGDCGMTLAVTMPDRRRTQVKRVVRDLPVTRWPRPGHVIPVDVSEGRRPKVNVRWDLLDFGADDGAGPALLQPSSNNAPETGRGGGQEPIPRVDISIVEFDDYEFAALGATEELERIDLIVRPEPSYLVRRYLLPTEKFRREWRRHWIRPVKEAVLIAGLVWLLQSDIDLTVAPIDVDMARIPNAEVVSQVVWVLLVAWRGAAWYQRRFVLTNHRVMLVKSVLRSRVASLPLSLAARTVVKVSLPGRILGYGTIRFSGVPWLRPLWSVGDLPNPTDIYLQVVEETFEPEAVEARYAPSRVDDGL